jgi:hypothetical protein
MMYLAMSRVRSLDGLYFTNARNDFNLSMHAVPTVRLRSELAQLSNNRLNTLSDQLREFLLASTSLRLASINVHSLLGHLWDFDTDCVITMADLWALQETRMDDTGHAVSIDGYNCVTRFKRPDVRAGGGAIYEKRGTATMATPHLLMRINHVEFANLCVRDDNIGDVCAADGVRTLLVSVYINPNTPTDDIESFLLYSLMAYSPKICTVWPRLKQFGYYNMPIILTGDFNFNLRNRANYEQFRNFGLQELGPTVVMDPSRSTTLGGSCVDIICVRDVPYVRRTTYINIHNYHHHHNYP